MIINKETVLTDSLKFSLDGGTKFTEIDGKSFMGYPPKDVNQIVVKRVGSTDVTFDLIINTG